jgi:hypothetical protein
VTRSRTPVEGAVQVALPRISRLAPTRLSRASAPVEGRAWTVDPPPPRPASLRLWRVSLSGPRAERLLQPGAGLGRIMIRVGRQLAPVPQWAFYWGDSEGFISGRSKPATGVTATEVRPLALRLACQVYYSGACQWGSATAVKFPVGLGTGMPECPWRSRSEARRGPTEFERRAPISHSVTI